MLGLALQEKLKFNSPERKVIWFLLALAVLLLDQITKHWASGALTYAEPVSFLPYFNFTLLHNEGAAFSFLADAGGWQRIAFSSIALLVSVFLVFWILCINPKKKIEITGLSLILGGAIGNLWDRIFLGYVVDFIDWFYVTSSTDCLPFFYSIFSTQSCHWPAFNIADSAILLGAGCLIIDMMFYDNETGNDKF